MLLITEYNIAKPLIVEAKSGGKSHFIEGIFMQGNMKNQNGRIYPTEILSGESKRFNEQLISQNRALGELNHPDGPTVNLDKVSHMITSLIQDGNNFIGKAKILNTPMGMIAKSFIDEGVKLGVSTRGMGSVKPDKKTGADIVQEDFSLATVDIVADPSAPDAFVNGIMEGKEWIFSEGGLLKSRDVKAIRHKLDTAGTNLEEKKLEVFKDFILGIYK